MRFAPDYKRKDHTLTKDVVFLVIKQALPLHDTRHYKQVNRAGNIRTYKNIPDLI